MTIKEKIHFIDDVLSQLEDSAHGQEAIDILTARLYIAEISESEHDDNTVICRYCGKESNVIGGTLCGECYQKI